MGAGFLRYRERGTVLMRQGRRDQAASRLESRLVGATTGDQTASVVEVTRALVRLDG
jgi:hypothetical protein